MLGLRLCLACTGSLRLGFAITASSNIRERQIAVQRWWEGLIASEQQRALQSWWANQQCALPIETWHLALHRPSSLQHHRVRSDRINWSEVLGLSWREASLIVKSLSQLQEVEALRTTCRFWKLAAIAVYHRPAFKQLLRNSEWNLWVQYRGNLHIEDFDTPGVLPNYTWSGEEEAFRQIKRRRQCLNYWWSDIWVVPKWHQDDYESA